MANLLILYVSLKVQDMGLMISTAVAALEYDVKASWYYSPFLLLSEEI